MTSTQFTDRAVAYEADAAGAKVEMQVITLNARMVIKMTAPTKTSADDYI